VNVRISLNVNVIVIVISSLAVTMTVSTDQALAQDSRDDEIFGSPAEAPAKAPVKPSAPPASPQASAIAERMRDTLTVGGRLEIRAGTGQVEGEKLGASGLDQLRQADVFFDTRPNKDLRAFVRARFSEQTPPADAALGSLGSGTAASTGADSSDTVRTDLDEAWLKWDWSDTLFATYGKQHLKWGSGRFWNPTDFTATQTRDPFALYDRRLGQELLKLHLPFEKQGYNLYAVAQLDDVERNDDIGGALRGEFAFGGIGEAAVTVQGRAHAPLRAGLDVSSALGPFDGHVESAVTTRHQRKFYAGTLDEDTGEVPHEIDRQDDKLVQTVVGLDKTFKFSDDDNFTIGVEYFDNQLGYDDRKLELFALFTGDAQPLYAGRRYLGTFVRIPQPGSWNDTQIYLNSISNLSDNTTVVRLTGGWTIFTDAQLELYLSGCGGDYGELCFRVPDDYKKLATSPGLTPSQQQAVAALPTKRTKSTAGAAVTINF
jgi:hypothetical protein